MTKKHIQILYKGNFALINKIIAVKLIAEDLLTKQVAENMEISESVVSKKINNIQLKTGTKSKSGIINFFKKADLLK